MRAQNAPHRRANAVVRQTRKPRSYWHKALSAMPVVKPLLIPMTGKAARVYCLRYGITNVCTRDVDGGCLIWRVADSENAGVPCQSRPDDNSTKGI